MGKRSGETKNGEGKEEEIQGQEGDVQLLLESYRISCEIRSVEEREIAQEIVE
jgi:hypothetical protein